VAGAAGLTLWTKLFGLSSSFVGLIGAFSSNAISAGVGALVGGWLCDRLGRKRIYQWDLLVYAFGLLWIIFAQAPWMMGPVVVLLLALALSGLGVLGIRIVFAHLFVLALVLWAMRRGMRESKMWEQATDRASVRDRR
jgi:inositol transporter-like SP family MFS transporter